MQVVCFISSLRAGGAERQLLYLASTLCGQGHEVEVVTYRKEPVFYGDLVHELHLSHTCISDAGGAPGIVCRLARHLREKRCDLLVAFQTGASTKACIAHMLYPHFLLVVSERSHNDLCLPYDRLRFLLYRRANAIVCNSFAQERFVLSHFRRLAGRVTVIPNFVDTDIFVRKRPEWSQPRHIAVTARVCTRKNVHGLVKAAAVMKTAGARFVIDWYGASGDSRYLRRCRRFIEKRGLRGMFNIHPAEKDVAAIYAGADIFCLPSFYEGTSNSLSEALASGLPVACSDVCDNALYVEEGKNGCLFNPCDTAEMASALLRMLSLDDFALTEAGACSRKLALERLGRDAYEHRYAELVNKLSSSRKIA